MISVGIIGGSGYIGKKLIQFCNSHPFVDAISVYAATTINKALHQIFPELQNQISNLIILDSNELSYSHDLYFTALPHGESLKYIPELIDKKKTVIDLSSDFRLNRLEDYTKWYKISHSFPSLLKNKVYGLADLFNNNEYKYNLIANPGCYPTAVLLSLIPIVKYLSDDILSISTVAYSGTSGAGKSANTDLLLSEMYGNVRAYNVNSHRHQPEIEQMLFSFGSKFPFSFTTHLLPISVGIYSTSVIHLHKEISQESINQIYNDTYAGSYFVRLRETPPNLNWVINTNFCDINVAVKKKVIVITTAIDNLIKGAAGQAIQNMNKFFNWEERLGIINSGVIDVQVH